MFKDIISFNKLQKLVRQSIKILQEIKSENKNQLKKLERVDLKPNYLVNSINYIISYNVSLEESERVNLPKFVNEWRDKKQENGKLKIDSLLFNNIFFQLLKQFFFLENSQQAVKRAKVLPTTFIDDEGTQPPPAAPICTTPSPFYKDLLIILSAYSLVTKSRLKALMRNNN